MSSSPTGCYSYYVFNRWTDYNGSPGASYLYNGFDQRVAKTVVSGTAIQFVYDEAGKLLGEYVNGAAVQEAVYLCDIRRFTSAKALAAHVGVIPGNACRAARSGGER